MKKLDVLLMSIILLLSCSSFVYADNSDVQQEVQDAANKSLDFAKEKFAEDPEKWGFSKGDDISTITPVLSCEPPYSRHALIGLRYWSAQITFFLIIIAVHYDIDLVEISISTELFESL